MFESVLLLAPKHFNASSVPAKCSKDRGGTARAREKGNVPEIARVLKNEHNHCLFQHLWMCFIQSCQVRCCVFPCWASRGFLPFGTLIWCSDWRSLSCYLFLWDQAGSWPPPAHHRLPTTWNSACDVHAFGQRIRRVFMCPTAQQSLASDASIHPQCSQEICKAK